jgi:DNA polymerase-3 subunit alpha
MGNNLFIHLHTHTEYSLSLGAIRLKELIKQTKLFNMPSVAVTDSGNMFGALEFSIAACKEGIQPIIGVEFLIQFDNLFKRKWIDHYNIENLTKIVLIAQTNEGFNNLLKLASDNYLHYGITTKNENGELDNKLAGNAYKYSTPRINFEWLKEYNKGIICLTNGVEGIIGKLLNLGDKERALKLTENLKDIFGDRLYMELMRHGTKNESTMESDFIDFSYKSNVPLVATNDCYFLEKNTYKAQDILSCIGSGRYLNDKNRPSWTKEHYFKSSEEMIDLFKDIPEAIENTINIAKRVSTMAYKRPPTLPHFPLPNMLSEDDSMKQKAAEGLDKRLKQKFFNEKNDNVEEQNKIKKIYFDRLEYENNIIAQMGFSGYFLIVSDFIKWSKENDVRIGPGRGSGAGSVVAWSLLITDIDPIKFDISFERFLNPERVSMPDFDIDFCERGRARSIEYVQNKYGKEMVARIITFNKLQAKGVIKDVGRVLGMNYQDTDRLTKTIPFGLTLSEALEQDVELQNQRQEDRQISELIDIALELEGLSKNSGLHAAGIVIGDKILEQICPLYSDGKSEMPAIQYTMKYAEEVGLVKFDFLGLSTLTVIRDTLLYLERRNIDIDIDNIPLNDIETYKMLAKADTLGVFQIESSGMKNVLQQMKPDRIEDITALVALYRPGPMDSIPSYIKRKNNDEKIECLHPKMLEVLKSTYGIIVYQDQVMNLARDLAGYTMGGADLLRRAMGKKNKEEMDIQRQYFIKGGVIKTKIFGKEVEVEIEGVVKHSNINLEVANEIFDLMAKFASYGFNLAHATAYGIIGYQTAYLRRYFPVEFCAASMNDTITNTDRIGTFVQDLRQHNIKILLPDVNESDVLFNVEYIGDDEDFKKKYKEKSKKNILDINIINKTELINKANDDYSNKSMQNDKENYAVRYALSGIKGIGQNVAEVIVNERKTNGPFKDIWNFIDRIDIKYINKKTIESLSKSGAFDSLYDNRRQLHDGYEILNNYKIVPQNDKENNQMSFLDMLNIDSKPKLPNVKDWTGEDKYQKEFEVYGFFISGHPLDNKCEEMESKGITFTDEMQELYDGDKIRIAGIIISTIVKSGQKGKYAFINIADPKGMIEIAIYKSDLIVANKDLIAEKNHNKILFECSVRKNEDDELGIRLIATEIRLLNEFLENTRAGELKKIDRKTKRFGKFFNNYGGNSNYGGNYNGSSNNSTAYLKKQTISYPYKEIIVYVNIQKTLVDIKSIIDNTKNNDANNTIELTKVILILNDMMKFELGKNYQIFDVERRRIENLNGVTKVDVILK